MATEKIKLECIISMFIMLIFALVVFLHIDTSIAGALIVIMVFVILVIVLKRVNYSEYESIGC